MTLPAVHALHLSEVVARLGVEPARLFEGFDLDEARLAEPGRALPVAVVERLVARARELTGEPGLGFHLGITMRAPAHGYVGFAAMAAGTLREALELVVRYSPTRTTALRFSLREEGDVASLTVEELVDLGTARDVILIALLVGLPQIGRFLTGRELPGEAHLAIPRPSYFDRFAPLVGDRMRFGCDANRLVFPAVSLDIPLAMADKAALRLAREQCERELDAIGRDHAFAARVRAALEREDGAFRSLEEVATRLGVSDRTLKRKLAAEGVSFSSLLDARRRERALSLLDSASLSLDEVAERLGYSDVANFTRAFRRWTGLSPGAYRKRRDGSR